MTGVSQEKNQTEMVTLAPLDRIFAIETSIYL